MTTQPVLQTQRLVLRPFTLADAPDVQRMVSDPAVSLTTLNIPYPYPEGGARDWIADFATSPAQGDSCTYAITLPANTLQASSTLIGSIHLAVNPRFARAEMGYWIGADYWRNGFCSASQSWLNQRSGRHR